MIFSLIAGSFLACGEKETNDTAAEVTNSCPDGAEITISDTYPVSGAADFYVLDTISFELTDEDPGASISVSSAAGEVAGTSSIDGSTVTFTPDAMLDASTEYTASLTYCNSADPVDVAFTTSSLGAPLEVDLTGMTYAVDIGSGNFVKPPGIGSLIGDALTNNILLGIVSTENNELAIRGAISVDGAIDQDTCTESLEDFPAADFSNAPYFEIPEGDVTVSVAGISATIYGLNVTGMFAADGSYFGGGELSGALDARDLVSVVGELGLEVETADDICGLVVGFGVPCEPCADGEPYCVGLEVNRLVANETGTSLVEVTAEDVQASIDAGECAAQ